MVACFIPVANLTWLEAIAKGNRARRTIVTRSTFKKIIRTCRHPLPEDIREVGVCTVEPPRPYYGEKFNKYTYHYHTEDAFVCNGENRTFKNRVEKEIDHYGRKKLVSVKIPKDKIGSFCNGLVCRHGFNGETELLSLLNAKTGKRILNVDETDEIELKFNGDVHAFGPSYGRWGYVFSRNNPTLGLLTMQCTLDYYTTHDYDVTLSLSSGGNLEIPRGVLYSEGETDGTY